MRNKNRNTDYDILDKILRESDRSQFGQNGRPLNPNGTEMTKEEFDQVNKTVDDIEKYLRSYEKESPVDASPSTGQALNPKL